MEERITRLLGREERPGTVVLRLDGGEVLEIAPGAVPAELPSPGEVLDQALLDTLRAAAARKAAARDLLSLLDRKAWTTVRLDRKLREAGHPPEAVAEVLAQAEQRGLHSDRAFADAFCRDTIRRKTVGRTWLAARLREKGVPEALAGEVAAAHLTADEEERLCRQAAVSRWRRQRSTDQRAVASVQRFLASRGFAPGQATRVAWETRPDRDPDTDPDAPCNSGPEGRS